MAINIIGYGPKTLANASNEVTLAAGNAWIIPSGQYQVTPGLYSFIQWFDPVTQLWRNLNQTAQPTTSSISSDGYNYRIANLTGTVVGASVTNAGTGYTNGIYPPAAQLGTAAAPSVTFAAGGGSVLAQGTIIVGGAINSTVTITAGGSNYTYPPTLIISNPPQGGVQATATCTISGGAINAVTVTNVGAGYTVAPTITVVRDPRDTTGSGAVLTVNATLAGSGTVTAITVPQGGIGHTSVPAITFSPASTTAATAIMCFTVTTANAQTGATNLGNGNVGFFGTTLATAQSTNTNPAITTGLFTPRHGFTAWSTAAGGGTTVVDGGLHQVVVPGIAYACISTGVVQGATTAVAATMGGVSDTSYVVPI